MPKILGWWLTLAPEHKDYIPLPLGAVVATARLVDVVPIVPWGADPPSGHITVRNDGGLNLWRYTPDGAQRRWTPGGDLSEFRSFGDYTPGRFAWLFENVTPLAEPVPAKGKQGLWKPDADLIAACGVTP